MRVRVNGVHLYFDVEGAQLVPDRSDAGPKEVWTLAQWAEDVREFSFDLRAGLARVCCPTLLMGGTLDPCCR